MSAEPAGCTERRDRASVAFRTQWPGVGEPGRWTTVRMKRFTTILLLTASVFLAGCSKPDVKYSDLSPATTATISGDTVTIHLKRVSPEY
jgi:hypothetical protein